MRERLETLLGAPVRLEELKHKPGVRRTLRAVGPRGRAIVKLYASGRAPAVAARLQALTPGPVEPLLPRVHGLEPARRAVVLTDVPGRPLREAVLAGDGAACARVGRVLAGWHGFWRSRGRVAALAPHTPDRERRILHAQLERAPAALLARVREVLGGLDIGC